jgi:hypothetical protein
MNAVYCDFDCFYLKPTEEEQDKQINKQPHICRLYNQRVYHNYYGKNAHPNIFRCDECLDYEEYHRIGG